MKFVIFNSNGTIKKVLDKVYTVHVGSGTYYSYINVNWESGRPNIATRISYKADRNVIFTCIDEFDEFIDNFISDEMGLSSRKNRLYNFVEYKPKSNGKFEYAELKEMEYCSFNGSELRRCKYYVVRRVIHDEECIRMINLFERQDELDRMINLVERQSQPISSHVITADQLKIEFNSVVQRYYAECDSNGGHEGTVKSHTYSAIADFIQEIAGVYCNTLLEYEKRR